MAKKVAAERSRCAEGRGDRHDFSFVGRHERPYPLLTNEPGASNVFESPRPDSILCRLCGQIRAYVVPEVERQDAEGAP